MCNWIYPQELAEGLVEGLPKMSITLQNSLRRSNKITYTKLGRHCVYKRVWIDEYLEKNIHKAEEKKK